MLNEEWLNSELDDLRAKALFRELRTYPEAGGAIVVDGRELLNLSCNDYLGFARHPALAEAAAKAAADLGCGATASRLVTGSLRAHAELEDALGAHKGYPAALLFASGFAVNLGLIPAVIGRHDQVFADRLSHASLMDGIVLSRATLQRFRHNDVEDLERLLRKPREPGRAMIVTESVFSMDGDMAPLAQIADLAEKYGAMLLVDEAHATGVFGRAGSGLVPALGLQERVNFCVGTLSKALGGIGGYVCCSAAARDFLVNRARSFIYSTAPPPPAVAAAAAALHLLAADHELGHRLLNVASGFRQRLRQAGLDTGASCSQIIPVMVGDSAKTLELAARLRRRGILAVGIRPPTVPAGTARLRLSVSLTHHPGELAWAAEVLAEECANK